MELREALELQERDLRVSQRGHGDECYHLVDEMSHAQDALEIAALTPLETMSDDTMFSFPLVIHASENDVDNGPYIHSLCATAAFNMGLACHLYAEHPGLASQHRKRYLCLVKAFYQEAFHMSKNLALPVLQLALCNNLVEVAFEQEDGEAAKFWACLFGNMTLHRPLRVSDDLWTHFVEASSFYVTHLSTTS